MCYIDGNNCCPSVLFLQCPLDGGWLKLTSTVGSYLLLLSLLMKLSIFDKTLYAPLVGLLFCVCADAWYLCALLWWNLKLANGSDHTLDCWRAHWGEWMTCRPVCCVANERTGLHCFFPSPAPGGYLTQNNIMHKVCFLGLQKSCRHLVLHKGQTIHHSALPSLSQLIYFFPFLSLSSVSSSSVIE